MTDQQIIADLRQRNLLLTQKLAVTEVRLENANENVETLQMQVNLLVAQRKQIAEVVKQFPETADAVRAMLQQEVNAASAELQKVRKSQGRNS